jgi:predicted phosphodiesterase
MVFHTVGDTGGIKAPQSQQIVANKMEEAFPPGAQPGDNPLFFYHLGDVVYYDGEVSKYYDQFFEPYIHYPAPIFAIAGNHDGDLDPSDPNPPASLAGFMEVFCDTEPHHLPIARDSQRSSMIQPNVYWTLVSPLVNMIGLYCNDTEHGSIVEPQVSWFIDELKNADAERKSSGKAIIVSLHYPAFSVDQDHGSSGAMQKFLDKSFDAAGVFPDIVLSGHVHNYQRFTRALPNGDKLPYIVAGGGGYWNLHKVGTKANPVPVPNSSFFPGITLETFCDDRFGFLTITIEKSAAGARTLKGDFYTVPRLQESWSAPAALFDSFSIDLDSHQIQ